MKLLPNNYIFWEALLLTMFHTSFEIHSKKLTPKALSFPLWKMRVCPRKRMSIDTSPFKRIRDFIVEWKSSVLHHKNSVKSLILLDLFRLKKSSYFFGFSLIFVLRLRRFRNLHNKFLPCFTYPVVSNRNRFSSNHSPYSASSICLLALSTADVSREAR